MSSKIKVRRFKSGTGWCISDPNNWGFIDGFRRGLLKNVTLRHDAPPMFCIPGYDSTGEGQGELVARESDVVMPKEVVRTESIVYDNRRRVFHAAGKPDQRIDSADFLLMEADGKATAGWVTAAVAKTPVPEPETAAVAS
jgi:hypothetical protein